jgi:hypothetical protein
VGNVAGDREDVAAEHHRRENGDTEEELAHLLASIQVDESDEV